MKTVIIRAAKALAVLAAAGILFLIIVVNFGTSDSRLVCSGMIHSDGGGGTPATLYAKVETYRWFVLWADHDAMISWEIQPGDAPGFGYYNESSFKTPITNFSRTEHLGSISSLSKQIFVATRGNFFEGGCR